jgi:hypothetical protein
MSLPFKGNPYDTVHVNTLQSWLERKVWLKMPSHKNNFTVYTEVFLQARPAEKQKVGSCWSAIN